ncbi:hypothetical protein D3C80_1827740 [compost metagenome]
MITSATCPALSIWSNKNTFAKNPENTGIPAIDSNDPVKIAANNGLVFPNPLKLKISSLSLSFVTYKTTENAAIPARA